MRRVALAVVLALVVACGISKKSPKDELSAEMPPPAPAQAAGALATTGAPVAMPGRPTPETAAAAPAVTGPAGTTALDTRAIEEATGLTGATMPDGVFRITKPRGDLKVTLDGFPITPRMGLAGWVAFRPHPSGAMLTGIMPVALDELQAVVSALADAGLETTALHAHFAGEEPRIFFLHFDGIGNAIALARGVHDVQDAIVRIRTARPLKATASEVHSDVDVAHLDSLLGLHGEHDGQVYRVTIPRPDVRVSELGIDLGTTMSPTSWAAFQGTAERSAVAGELMLTAAEVQPVIHVLRESHIGVVGIHDDSCRENPRLVFVSFWGVGRREALAAGVRRALDQLPHGG